MSAEDETTAAVMESTESGPSARGTDMQEVTEYNVGRWCMSEDECNAAGISFAAYERGVADAASAFARNRTLPAGVAASPGQLQQVVEALQSILDITQEEHFIRGADSKLYEIGTVARAALAALSTISADAQGKQHG